MSHAFIQQPCFPGISSTNQSFQDPEFAIEAPEFIPPGPLETLERMAEKTDKLLVAISNGDLNLARFYLGWDQQDESESEEEMDENEEIAGMEKLRPTLCHPLCQCKKCIPLAKVLLFSFQ